jgi:hypothetical protein
MTRSRFLLVVVIGLLLSFAPSVSASEAVITGSGTRVKSFFVKTITLYNITHSMASKPDSKSKQAVIDADVNKMFEWTTVYDGMPVDKVKKAFQEGFNNNGFNDQNRINQFNGAFTADLAAGSRVTIRYDAGSKSTTVTTPNGKATIAGADFMKGAWGLWFGKNDQPSLGDALISKL